MRRAFVLTLVLCLLAALFAPAAVAKKKKKKKAKTYNHTLYLHGNQALGEAEIPDTWQGSAWHKMDSTEPEGSSPKSMFVTNYLRGPNATCSGNGLLPTWRGEVAGNGKGDMTVSLHTVATPGAQIVVDVFADATGGCNSSTVPGVVESSDYVEPIATETVEVAPGPGVTEVTFAKLKFKAVSNLVLQVSMAKAVSEDPPVGSVFYPAQVRILYDSADYPSSISFTCVKKACTE